MSPDLLWALTEIGIRKGGVFVPLHSEVADECMNKMKTTSKLAFIAKSNSLCCSTKGKKTSLLVIEKQTDEKLKKNDNAHLIGTVKFIFKYHS